MDMKFIKALGAVVLAAVIALGGYYIGGKSKPDDSLINAIPKEEIDVSQSPDDRAMEGERPPENAGDSVTYITRFDKSAAADGNWSVVDTYTGDVTGGGEEDTVTVYTSAESYDGEILWDDSQNWIVEIYDGEGYYTLLTQNISGGNVYINIIEDAQKETVISVVVSSTANFTVKQYAYTTSGFVETTVCDTRAVNMKHSSIPFYN